MPSESESARDTNAVSDQRADRNRAAFATLGFWVQALLMRFPNVACGVVHVLQIGRKHGLHRALHMRGRLPACRQSCGQFLIAQAFEKMPAKLQSLAR